MLALTRTQGQEVLANLKCGLPFLFWAPKVPLHGTHNCALLVFWYILEQPKIQSCAVDSYADVQMSPHRQ